MQINGLQKISKHLYKFVAHVVCKGEYKFKEDDEFKICYTKPFYWFFKCGTSFFINCIDHYQQPKQFVIV